MNYYYITLDTCTVTVISRRDYLVLAVFILIFLSNMFNVIKVSP